MACSTCEEAQADEYAAALVPLHGTRLAIKACDRHCREIAALFAMLDALYDAAYKEAVTSLTDSLLAMRREDGE
jgi:hypothetical protein